MQTETHELSLHKHMGEGPQAQKNKILDPRGEKRDETSWGGHALRSQQEIKGLLSRNKYLVPPGLSSFIR